LAGCTAIGEVSTGEGLEVRCDGMQLDPGVGGWRNL